MATSLVEFFLDPRFVAGVMVGYYIADNRPRKCNNCGHQNMSAISGMDGDARLSKGQRRMALANDFLDGAAGMARTRIADRMSVEASESFDSLFPDREQEEDGWSYG